MGGRGQQQHKHIATSAPRDPLWRVFLGRRSHHFTYCLLLRTTFCLWCLHVVCCLPARLCSTTCQACRLQPPKLSPIMLLRGASKNLKNQQHRRCFVHVPLQKTSAFSLRFTTQHHGAAVLFLQKFNTSMPPHPWPHPTGHRPNVTTAATSAATAKACKENNMANSMS